MAAINNFSLVGIGSSVKLGKGGIVLAQSGGKLTVDTVALATESFVTGQNYLTDATAASAGYLKQVDIDALNYVDSSELATALGAYTTTATLESTVAGYGFIKLSDISATYVDTTELATALADYTLTSNLATVATSGLYSDLTGTPVIGTDTQAWDADLDAIAALTGDGILAKTGGVWGMDTNSYLTSADLSGYLQTTDIGSSVQAHDDDLDAIAALAGTSGILTKTAANTWSLDTNTYLTTGDASSTYAPINNPTFTGTVTLAADPVSALQAATKQYVDGIAAGLTFKAAVRVATTANVGTYATGQITGAPSTVDGVTLVAGDRILVKAQTAGLENGIYSVTTVGTGANGVWDRAADFDEPSEVNGGTFVFVTEGSTLADKGFVLVSDNPITLGTDALNWSQYSSTGTVSVAAGTGISVSESLGAYTVSLANISGVSGSYGAAGKTITLTVDGQGRITAVTDTDIAIDWTQITSGTPTTLSGYGITDGLSTSTTFGGDVSGTYSAITLASVGTPVTGSFVKITTDAKGRVTATAAVTATDLNTVYGYTPVNPSSLATVATTGAYSDLTGTPTLATVATTGAYSDLTGTPDLSVYVNKDGSVAMTGDLDLGTNKIVNVVDPTSAQDAATKAYVDSAVTAASSNGDHTAKVAIAFGTTSGNLLATLPTGSIVSRIIVKVATPFDNAATITATQNSTTVEDGSFSDLTTAGIYVIDTFYDVTTGGALTYSITGSPTVGAGTVYVEYTI